MELTLFDLSLLLGTSATTAEFVKETSASTITAFDDEPDWGDIYEEYEDFNCTTQSW